MLLLQRNCYGGEQRHESPGQALREERRVGRCVKAELEGPFLWEEGTRSHVRKRRERDRGDPAGAAAVRMGDVNSGQILPRHVTNANQVGSPHFFFFFFPECKGKHLEVQARKEAGSHRKRPGLGKSGRGHRRGSRTWP